MRKVAGIILTKEKRDPERDSAIHIDLGLGGLFKGLGNLMDLVSELAENTEAGSESEGSKSGEINFGEGSKLRGVYGFTVRSGIGGMPRVESFGNIRETEKGPVVAETREPLIDIFDEGKTVLVVVELPGVTEKEIDLSVQGDVLALNTNGKRKYAKEILLPAAVLDTSMTTSYNNGVLEVRLAKPE